MQASEQSTNLFVLSNERCVYSNIMRVCSICEKGSRTGGKRAFLRSHYNPSKTVRRYPNLQWAKLSSGERAKICARCLKKLHK